MYIYYYFHQIPTENLDIGYVAWIATTSNIENFSIRRISISNNTNKNSLNWSNGDKFKLLLHLGNPHTQCIVDWIEIKEK